MKRRLFISQASGGLLSASAFLHHFNDSASDNMSPTSSFKTRVCDLLGIEFPIIQAGMSFVAGPELVAAVSNAGGLGILTATMVEPEIVRKDIQQIRSLTDKPFGVNLVLQDELLNPRSGEFPARQIQSIQAVLNPFRKKLGIPESQTAPPPLPPLIRKAFDVIIEEAVPVFSAGLGNPDIEMVRRCREKGIKVMTMISNLEDAAEAERNGVDLIVAQGSEAGGHRSTKTKKPSKDYANIGLSALIPQVVRQTSIPVIAAGGIADGAGMLAAFCMGAEGIMMGTRFVATTESIAPDTYKEQILSANSDQTTITDVFTGMYARVIRNTFTEEYSRSGAAVFSPGRHYLAVIDIVRAAAEQQNGNYYNLYAGQGIDQIRDIIPAGDVIRNIMQEAQSAVDQLKRGLFK